MSENILETKPPSRRATAWQLTFAGWFVFLVQFDHLSNFSWSGGPKPGIGSLIWMTVLFGVLCLCLVQCPSCFWMAKGILATAVVLGLMLELRLFVVYDGSNQRRTLKVCLSNLKQIEGAKADWALEERKTTNDIPSAAILYGTNAYISREPKCPEGGVYVIGRVGLTPLCSVEDHSLE